MVLARVDVNKRRNGQMRRSTNAVTLESLFLKNDEMGHIRQNYLNAKPKKTTDAEQAYMKLRLLDMMINRDCGH